ncbi:MAG: DUF2480 family protein [Flavobacteriaceae bacterium]|nr:DUF2480 family protein [Flavobacteriaceae bacterium]
MEEPIVNRVAKSPIVTIDLEQFYPTYDIVIMDIADWLKDGFLLIEKDFRATLKAEDFSRYKNKLVGVICSKDALIPDWAWMLIEAHLSEFAALVCHGDKATLISKWYTRSFSKFDFSQYQNKPVIVKACSTESLPPEVFIQIAEHLKPFAKLISYGEACSSVPVYKKITFQETRT